MKQIDVQELDEQLKAHPNQWLILDVREADELAICKIEQAMHIPMNSIPGHYKNLPSDKNIAVLCHHGMRSASVINWLEQNTNDLKLFNVQGGIAEWTRQIDPSLKNY